MVRRGNTVRITTTWKDFSGTLVDPDSHSINIYDPAGALLAGMPITNPVKETPGDGVFHYDYDSANDATLGVYSWIWIAVISGKDSVRQGMFKLTEVALSTFGIMPDEVIAEAGTPTFGNLGFASQDDMSEHIESRILPGAESLINQFLHRSYTASDVPAAVAHCAVRVAARGLMNIAINKKGGLITVNQWMQALADPTIFTPELKAEIQEFMLTRAGAIAVSSYKTRAIARRWDEDTDEFSD
jgi:hypothetical protein